MNGVHGSQAVCLDNVKLKTIWRIVFATTKTCPVLSASEVVFHFTSIDWHAGEVYRCIHATANRGQIDIESKLAI